MFKCIVVSLIVAAAWAAPTEKSEKTCNGGRKEGESVDIGRYWYECKSGELIQKGCLSETKTRLNAHESYKTNGYVMECVSDAQNGFGFAYKACLGEDGAEHGPKDTWQDANYWYTCVVAPNSIHAEVTGCIDEGKRYNVDESVEKGDLIYTCSHNGENVGWNIFPNRSKDAKPGHEHVQQKQSPAKFN